MIPDGCDDSIDIETEVKTEQNSMDSEEVRAVVAISVLILISILLIMLIRRGKPPANEQHRYFVEKQYTKF